MVLRFSARRLSSRREQSYSDRFLCSVSTGHRQCYSLQVSLVMFRTAVRNYLGSTTEVKASAMTFGRSDASHFHGVQVPY